MMGYVFLTLTAAVIV